MIEFRIEGKTGVPPYLQLVRQVEDAIRLGRLTRDDKLPTIKHIARTLAINPNTVMKAYRELEHRGLAQGRPGLGTFISGDLTPISTPTQNELRHELTLWINKAHQAGLGSAEIAAIVTAVLTETTNAKEDTA